MQGNSNLYCVRRSDLKEGQQGVPLSHNGTTEFLYSDETLPYRWLAEDTDDEQFQVYWKGKWYNGQSIDFDFPGKLSTDDKDPETEYWGEDPEYLIEDWKHEVREDNTRLGYWDWVEARKEEKDGEDLLDSLDVEGGES